MARYVCSVCGYVYDEAQEGTRWADLPNGWTCPVCGSSKSMFEAEGDSAKDGSGGAGTSILSPHAAQAHRIFGYVFLTIYVVLMFQMVPRLWTYQIEFAPRTAIHIAAGIAIGAVLLLKIGIVRFFRRLDQQLVPGLGTAILVGSVVLIGISVPSALREALATRKLFTEENQVRVRTLLAQTDLDESGCTRFSSLDSLRAGQQVLRQECVMCHDLRTVLAKPRTPQRWRQTVSRMADRASFVDPLAEEQQWQVTAYLVALSPELQQSAQQLSQEQDRREQAQKAAQTSAKSDPKADGYDSAAAKKLFETKCSQCHKTKLVSQSPPKSAEDARELVAMMVEEGLEATPGEIAQIVRYLTEIHAKLKE